MAKLSREERDAIARSRILNILRQHGVANSRTLEQKISDAGPNPQRIDPHILTPMRNLLVDEGVVSRLGGANQNWYHLAQTPPDIVARRLAVQLPVWQAVGTKDLGGRIGQALEIAVYRALLGIQGGVFFGRYSDLDEHDDSTNYSKDEPPRHIGERATPGKKCLDFLVHHPTAGMLGIECKNVREWLYPGQTEIIEALRKCIALDCLPVIIARRIPFVTFRLLHACGAISHQMFNQIYPASAQAIADQAKHKDILGYHDIRTGNIPDHRLVAFIQKHLFSVAPAARKRFDEYKDLLAGYASGDLSYISFAARVRRREQGMDEDYDPRDERGDDPADWD